RRAVYAMAGSTAVAFGILELAFLRSDFTFATVASHSSTTTPAFYRLTAMWSSQEGSLLLWLFLLGTWSSIILFPTRHQRPLLPRVGAGAVRGVRPVLRFALVLRGAAVPPPPAPAAGGGRRPGAAAARAADDDPPPDALLGVHAVHDPVRVRGRGADHAPPG